MSPPNQQSTTLLSNNKNIEGSERRQNPTGRGLASYLLSRALDFRFWTVTVRDRRTVGSTVTSRCLYDLTAIVSSAVMVCARCLSCSRTHGRRAADRMDRRSFCSVSMGVDPTAILFGALALRRLQSAIFFSL